MKFYSNLIRFGFMASLVGTALTSVACDSKKMPKTADVKSSVLGTVDGREINVSDLSDAEKNKLYKTKKQFYDATENLLSQHYFDQYLENYRQKNKLSSVDDAKKHFFDKNAKVAKTDVTKFLKDNEASPQLKQIPEDKRVEIVSNYLSQMAQSNATQQVITAALNDGKIVVRSIEKPMPPKVSFKVPGYSLFKDVQTPVTIVEFADYQCPYCVMAHAEIKKVLEHYNAKNQKVNFVYYDFPLSFHDQALPASVAAYCASQQDQFWPMHNLIYKREARDGITAETFTNHAQTLKLDMVAFKKCQEDPKSAEVVNAQMAAGHDAGVEGTPAIFVNGERFEKQTNFANLKAAIDPLL